MRRFTPGLTEAKVTRFDELVDGTSGWLTEVHELYGEEPEVPTGQHVHFVLIGWSERAQEFVAIVFASQGNYAPRLAEGVWAWPMP